jgi:sorbitol/mannitol transport system permease protein
MSTSRRIHWGGLGLTAVTYIIAIVIFFPIFWMVLTSFKTEADAFAFPPKLLFEPTLDNWQIALVNSPFTRHITNTVIITLGSTALALALGIPAAYALAYYPTKRSDFTLTWLISTRMLPPVGIIVPLFIISRDLGLRDTHLSLIIMYTAMNLPLVIWMMRSFFLDVPYEILEAARIDGVTLFQEFRLVVIPLVLPGLFATILLCLIFAWNEFFFAFNLTVTNAAPLSVYISSFKTSEGLFWAKMSAAATASVLPVVIAGWFAQKQLVKGLTMGAVK